jgi:hypothetical protein
MAGDLRDEYLARVVKSRTFADVGGLWGTVNEKVSVAHHFGATELTMIDMQPEGNEWWQRFHERLRESAIAHCRCIASTLESVHDGAFDVVHCSGVLYHHPSPMVLLADLRRITLRNLVLTSAITQEVIENEQGTYRLPPSGVIFVPGLSDDEREILHVYWKKAGAEALGISAKTAYRLDDFAPWWWLPTAQAMKAMCVACGFRVLDAGPTWNGNAYTVLLEVA